MQLVGNRVTLRTTEQGDLNNLLVLWNDGRVMRWVGFPAGLGYDVERMARWFDRLQANPSSHHFVVYADPVGFCGEVFYAVDQEHGRAGLDIKLVPAAQGRGLGADALRTLIRHVFESERDVAIVWTEPRADNAASRRLYARCGLRPDTRPADLEPFDSFWSLSRARWSALSAA